ncbi:hypothetical protein HYH02_008182 [Chlamydomonas schloesseri]|uniref:Peptidase S26 domain-containing protein n=1 Tax=Chlamydomonas schloesseri TaxID=2026947 RepID=A0A835WHD6_9CHLO|nr:hypothetical protein HYH02_008182 [Chlamydomonas schloesseri]|eukprot:KAG2447030.1 hypothetical protein HYH02_008182 [Chlamydomonas schloesseri]
MSAASAGRRWERLRAWASAAGSHTAVFLHTLSCFYVVSRYGAFLSKVTGPSMFPTFGGRGDFVIAEAVTPIWGQLQQGDVVICTRPVDPAESIIKRVVAMEGEEVVLYPDREHHEVRRIKVPPGHVWIQGDNLTHSLDSRQYGPVPLAMVRGRVLLQVWPRLQWVDNSMDAVRKF